MTIDYLLALLFFFMVINVERVEVFSKILFKKNKKFNTVIDAIPIFLTSIVP